MVYAYIISNIFRFFQSSSYGNAVASACEYIFQRQTGYSTSFSRLYIYFNGRVIDQNVVLGICKEKLWPYKRHLLNRKPPESVYKQARCY